MHVRKNIVTIVIRVTHGTYYSPHYYRLIQSINTDVQCITYNTVKRCTIIVIFLVQVTRAYYNYSHIALQISFRPQDKAL